MEMPSPPRASLCVSLFVLRCSSLKPPLALDTPGIQTLFFDTLFNRLLGLLCPKNEPEARPRSKSVCAYFLSLAPPAVGLRPSIIAHHQQGKR